MVDPIRRRVKKWIARIACIGLCTLTLSGCDLFTPSQWVTVPSGVFKAVSVNGITISEPSDPEKCEVEERRVELSDNESDPERWESYAIFFSLDHSGQPPLHPDLYNCTLIYRPGWGEHRSTADSLFAESAGGESIQSLQDSEWLDFPDRFREVDRQGRVWIYERTE